MIQSIKILSKRIEALQDERLKLQNIEPEMTSDLMFVDETIKNINIEIEGHLKAIEVLSKI